MMLPPLPSLASVMDLMLDAICVVDPQGRFIFVSAAGERIFGYTPAEMIGRQMIDLVYPDDRARTLNAVDEIVEGRHKPHFENRYVRKDGSLVHIMWSARWSEADQVRVAVARDVTGRRRAEAVQVALYAISEAAHAADDLLTLYQSIHAIIGELLPARNCFVALHDEKRNLLTFPYHVDEFHPPPVPQGPESAMASAQVIRSGRPLLLTRELSKGASEDPRPDVNDALDWLGVPLNAKNRVFGALVVKSYSDDARYTPQDVELLNFVSAQIAAAIDRKQVETWLHHIARHDSLTDLPNRVLFDEHLTTALALARRDHARLSLLYLDLDMFKEVNDSFGHAAGDLLLQEVAHRIRHCVRASDTVGRVGGDEFLVLLNHVGLREHACAVAEKLRTAVARPYDLAGHRSSVSASIGIASYPEHGDDPGALVRYADEAMYVAKHAGGNRVQVAGPPSPPA